MTQFSHGARELFIKDEQGSSLSTKTDHQELQEQESSSAEPQTDLDVVQPDAQAQEEQWLMPSLKFATPKIPSKKVSPPLSSTLGIALYIMNI